MRTSLKKSRTNPQKKCRAGDGWNFPDLLDVLRSEWSERQERFFSTKHSAGKEKARNRKLELSWGHGSSIENRD